MRLEPYEEIYQKSRDLKDYEPVPGDFLMKKTGMDILLRFVNLDNSGLGLEIGCGSGINAAFLSSVTRNLIATDLPFYNAETHTIGMSIARSLLDKLSVRNVRLLSCSGERLPFQDDAFDFVYSASVLEHIDDKEAALKEMMRVVKPGGAVIFIVPTYFQSMYAFLHLYLYIARRILEVSFTKIFGKPPVKQRTLLPKLDDSARSSSKIIGSFRQNHPSFPLPEPHGSYRSIFQEFRAQLPWRWLRIARRCGAGSIDSFAFLFLPFNILEVFSTRMLSRLYYTTRDLHYLLGRSILQYFCYAWCIVARK